MSIPQYHAKTHTSYTTRVAKSTSLCQITVTLSCQPVATTAIIKNKPHGVSASEIAESTIGILILTTSCKSAIVLTVKKTRRRWRHVMNHRADYPDEHTIFRREIPIGWNIRERTPDETSNQYYGGYEAISSELTSGGSQQISEKGTSEKRLCFEYSHGHGNLPEFPHGEPLSRIFQSPTNDQPVSYRSCSEFESGPPDQTIRRSVPDEFQRRVYTDNYENTPELSAAALHMLDYENATEGPQNFVSSHNPGIAHGYISNKKPVTGTRLSWYPARQLMHHYSQETELIAENTNIRESIGCNQLEIAKLFPESEMQMPLVAACDQTEERSFRAHRQLHCSSNRSLGRNRHESAYHLRNIDTDQLSSDTEIMSSSTQSGSIPEPRSAEPNGSDQNSFLWQQADETCFDIVGTLTTIGPNIALKNPCIGQSHLNTALPTLGSGSYRSKPRLHSRQDGPSILHKSSRTSELQSPWSPCKSRTLPTSCRTQSIIAHNATGELGGACTSDQNLSIDMNHKFCIEDMNSHSTAIIHRSLDHVVHDYSSQIGQLGSITQGSPLGVSPTSECSRWSFGFEDTQGTPISVISPISGILGSPVTTNISKRMFQ